MPLASNAPASTIEQDYMPIDEDCIIGERKAERSSVPKDPY
jgi:hypothetical protein